MKTIFAAVLAAVLCACASYDGRSLVPGQSTTAQEVRELFGPPWQKWRAGLKQRDVWDYPMLVDNRMMNFFVQFSDDGIVREAYLLHDPIYDAPDGRA